MERGLWLLCGVVLWVSVQTLPVVFGEYLFHLFLYAALTLEYLRCGMESMASDLLWPGCRTLVFKVLTKVWTRSWALSDPWPGRYSTWIFSADR